MKDVVTHQEKIIYSQIYHTGPLGLRLTPSSNNNAKAHLILSGDSNMFGLGVSDNETLPARLAAKIKSYAVYIDFKV